MTTSSNPVVGTELTATWRPTRGGVPYDPDEVYAWTHSPANVTTPLTPTMVVSGQYAASFTPTLQGTWVVRFSDSPTPPNGSTNTTDQSFTVDPLLY